MSSSNVPAASLPTTLDFPFMEFIAPEKPYASPFPADIPDGVQPTPKCAELFGALKEAGWNHQDQLRSTRLEPKSSPAYEIRLGIAKVMEASIIGLHDMLNHREHLVRIHQKSLEVIEENVSNGVPRKRAEKLTLAQLILFLSRKVEDEDDQSATDFVLNIAYFAREGARWQELIDAVSSPEIMLIGRDHDEECDEENGDDHKNEITSATDLEEQFHKDYKSIDIARIIKSGHNDVFAKMKELLLLPDLQLKETCRRLSGISQLINRLGEVEEGFGVEETISPTNKEHAKSKEGKDSESVSSLLLELQDRIREVLWKNDSGFQSEMVTLLSKVASLVIAGAKKHMSAEAEVDGKETSSNDDGSEEISETNVGEQNQGFDDDFCIHFLNSDAFSAI
ncbi:hypothetical protein EG329_008595 [Mollisiaceae sp. DMI_Dod_QoI]|nr:hypothetical protein EG329_008595 [Helotiales sp. DMI_Dod_QoI]